MQAIVEETRTVAPAEPARLAWIREQLATISYQHWTFELVDNGPDFEPLVMIRFLTVNSLEPSQPFTAEAAYRVDDMPTTVEGIKRWALAAISHAMMHEIAETLTVGGEPVIDPHAPENRPWDGALYLRICQAARNNGDPFHGVLYADAAAMVAAHMVPEQVALRDGQCHEHLTHNVAPRRLLDARATLA